MPNCCIVASLQEIVNNHTAHAHTQRTHAWVLLSVVVVVVVADRHANAIELSRANRDANQWMLWRRFCGRCMLSLLFLLVLLTPLFLSSLQPNCWFFVLFFIGNFCFFAFYFSNIPLPQHCVSAPPRANCHTLYFWLAMCWNWFKLTGLLACLHLCVTVWRSVATRLSVPSRSWHPHGIPYRLHDKWHSVYVRPAIKCDIDRASHHPNHDSVCGQNHCRY